MPVTSESRDSWPVRVARRAGIVLLVLIHVGLVALGVFVAGWGLVGWEPDALRRTAGPGEIPGMPPVVIGTVVRLGTNELVVSGYADERVVRVDGRSVVRRLDGSKGFANLQPGHGVVVWGTAGESATVQADTILVGPAP